MSDMEIDRTVLSHGGIRAWSATHKGTVRGHNEDRCVNRPELGLFAVADGAGGHDNGQLAASAVAASLGELPAGLPAAEMLQAVKDRLAACHASLRDQAAQMHPGAMIATTVVVLLLSDDFYACLWVGDSRIYLLRDGVLSRVTKDHSLVQELVDAGIVDQADAEKHPRANIITRAIGADTEQLDVDLVTDRAHPGDRFLLCSDGLTKAIGEPEIASLLGADEDGPAERLVLAALRHNATDNVTAVTVQIMRTFDDDATTVI